MELHNPSALRLKCSIYLVTVSYQAGLVQGKRIKQWTFYKRDEKGIKELKKMITANL
jgi:hypothetical protein